MVSLFGVAALSFFYYPLPKDTPQILFEKFPRDRGRYWRGRAGEGGIG